jgi:SAM-dependent methyltransferase
MLSELLRRRPSLGIKIRADAEEYGIQRFLKYASDHVKPSDLLLDAGAGECPHRRFFSHVRYQSCDIDDNRSHSHTFLCDVQSIPQRDDSYDAVLCIQVLQFMPDPQKAINELYRILRPGGSLFLSAPQGWGVHSPPYHFFNFTCYGLERLFKTAGFEIVSIQPRGGMFWYLGKRIRKLPTYIYDQHRPGSLAASRRNGIWRRLAFLSTLPVYALALPVCRYIVPLACFYLDRLDEVQEYTLGYACHCRKPPASSPASSAHG